MVPFLPKSKNCTLLIFEGKNDLNQRRFFKNQIGFDLNWLFNGVLADPLGLFFEWLAAGIEAACPQGGRSLPREARRRL
jgi:hypothetical protein